MHCDFSHRRARWLAVEGPARRAAEAAGEDSFLSLPQQGAGRTQAGGSGRFTANRTSVHMRATHALG